MQILEVEHHLNIKRKRSYKKLPYEKVLLLEYSFKYS